MFSEFATFPLLVYGMFSLLLLAALVVFILVMISARRALNAYTRGRELQTDLLIASDD